MLLMPWCVLGAMYGPDSQRGSEGLRALRVSVGNLAVGPEDGPRHGVQERAHEGIRRSDGYPAQVWNGLETHGAGYRGTIPSRNPEDPGHVGHGCGQRVTDPSGQSCWWLSSS